ncbi:hypothetical protein WN48_05183 [Eufriesea mexicana]|uniref:Uncharacterized protein n=1 Tax=Eufriesea mexicana TaxID=516756 RepID=A0A310SLD7_9HYME|nr:hypothetical protein WN48_05183 [Eufriesea mexicana]
MLRTVALWCRRVEGPSIPYIYIYTDCSGGRIRTAFALRVSPITEISALNSRDW